MPTSTFQTMTAYQQLDVANTQIGRADIDEEDHRRQQTQLDNSSSTPVTTDNLQTNAASNQVDRKWSLSATSVVHTATKYETCKNQMAPIVSSIRFIEKVQEVL